MKGAPELVLERCSRIYANGSVVELTEGFREDVLKATKRVSEGALRT